jgi:hemoglobin
MKNHLANPLVNSRYMNSEDLARVERRAVEFFCAGTGGPETYTGKEMVVTRNEVLAVLWSMRREVLRV